MKTEMAAAIPTVSELTKAIGSTVPIWRQLVDGIAKDFPGVKEEWKPSKVPFGRLCLLKQKERTLLYLIPKDSAFEASLVLGERAVALALKSDLSSEIKKMITEARQYAEGRGIRLAIFSSDQVAVVRKLVAIKTTPK